jgi:hypothetical protein
MVRDEGVELPESLLGPRDQSLGLPVVREVGLEGDRGGTCGTSRAAFSSWR